MALSGVRCAVSPMDAEASTEGRCAALSRARDYSRQQLTRLVTRR
jgi:hypothetical protein